MIKLKPCPFCGGEAVNKQDGEPIYCGSCYSSMPYGICEKDMIELWNSRTQNDKLTEERNILREALELVSNIIPMSQNAHGGGYMLILSNDDCRIIKETLEQVK